MQQAFQQHGSLVGGLHRFASHFQQRIELDGVDTDAFFLGRRRLRTLFALFAAVEAAPGRCRWRRLHRGHHFGQFSGWRSCVRHGTDGRTRIAARWHHGCIHAFPVEAVGRWRSGKHGRSGSQRGRRGRCSRGWSWCRSLGLRRLRLAFDGVGQQGFQILRQGRQAVRFGAVVQLGQLVGHEARRLQRRFDRQRRDRRGASAQRIEQVLGQVASRDHGRQAHEARTAFNRVEGAKYRVQCFFVIRVTLKPQQVLFNVDRQIHRLDDEILQHIIH